MHRIIAQNKHIFSLLILLSISLIVTGCGGGGGGDDGNDGDGDTTNLYSISGYVQKGPFISGSSITIQELHKINLDPTGNSYQSTTTDDFGTFALGSKSESEYVEVIATGFYYNEVQGLLSSANITLRSIADIGKGEIVNINILTTLEKDRIKYLILNEGKTFIEARTQAEEEILSIFNLSSDDLLPFNRMDMSQDGSSNAVLLAVSAVLQGDNTEAELSELISKINLDIREDGTLDGLQYIEELKNNANNLDATQIRENLTGRYQSLGLSTTIPAFEGYIDPMVCGIDDPQTWYQDTDGDGYGNANASLVQCAQPANYILNNTDCNDGDDNEHPGQTWHEDSDSDGFGNASVSQVSCEQPSDYVLDSSDCDDTNHVVNPTTVWYQDNDNDSYGNSNETVVQCAQPVGYVLYSGDCVESDADVNPGQSEVCDNGKDDDCNNSQDCDDEVCSCTTWYQDSDGDGYGDLTATLQAVSQPDGYVTDNIDCDDSDINKHPGQTWYADSDNDGFGNAGVSLVQCAQPVDYVLNNTDCDDSDVNEHPGQTWYLDGDGDGFGNANVSQIFCEQPSGYVLYSTDCDDSDSDKYPGQIWFEDSDNDGFGNTGVQQTSCEQPVGYILDSADCDDNDINEYPGQVWFKDADGDGYSDGITNTESCERPIGYSIDSELASTSGDCDDEDSESYPGQIWYQDIDNDGFGNPDILHESCLRPEGFVTDNSDCNDEDGGVNSSEIEICNDNKDNDCDGSKDCMDSECLNDIECEPTEVNGVIDIDTTWSITDSPFVVIANILVSENVKLTIEPGVIIKFRNSDYSHSYKIQVDGILDAQGEQDNPIIFTTEDPMNWGLGMSCCYWDRIEFTSKSVDWDEDTQTGSVLRYCIIENAGTNGGDWEGAIFCNGASPLIMDNTFKNNNIVSIQIQGSTNTIIKRNYILGLSKGVMVTSGSALIEDNYILYSVNAIETHDSVNDLTVIGNTIICRDECFQLLYQTPCNTTIYKNNIESDTKSAIWFRDWTACDSFDVTFNNISCAADEQMIYMWEGSSFNDSSINAINNWWGSTDSSEIEQLIYHHVDDYTLPTVIYEPFATEEISDAGSSLPPPDTSGIYLGDFF